MSTNEPQSRPTQMPLTLSEITTADDLMACEALQTSVFGERSHQILRRPLLASIQQSGGLLLGAWETLPIGTRVLRGLLVDLHAHIDGFPARVTAVHLVSPDSHGRGIGTALRRRERRILRGEGVSLVGLDARLTAQSGMPYGASCPRCNRRRVRP